MDEPANFSTAPPVLSNHFSDYGANAPRTNFASHNIDPNLAFENEAEFQSHFVPQLEPNDGEQLPLGASFTHRNISTAPFPNIRSQVAPQQPPIQIGLPIPQQQSHAPTGAAFNLLAPQAQASGHEFARQPALERIQQENGQMQERMASGLGKKDGAHFQGMKLVQDPPNLDQWREKLFNVDGIVQLTEDEYAPLPRILLEQGRTRC